MNTETVTLEARIFYTLPPEHTKYGCCLCDGCWQEYLGWCDRHEPERRP